MELRIDYALIIFSFATANLVSVNGNYTLDTLLRTNLQTGYERTARPAFPTTVNLFYVFKSLQALDIQNQLMTTTGWLAMNWYDPRLVWNASDYANISEIDANWVWRPEHYVTNSADDFTFFGYDNGKTRFHLISDGTVRWDLPFYAKTSCDVSIAKFPFDAQNCFIQIFFMEVNDVDVILNVTSKLVTNAYLEHGEWQFEGGEAVKTLDNSCCPVSQVSIVEIHLSFSRLRPFYIINIIIPAMLLTVCMVLTFLLPTDCGERLGFSLTILLSYTVLMSIISEMMPTTSRETPHISIYLLLLLSFCAICVINIVMHVKMFYIETKPPRKVQKFFLVMQKIAFFKCCKKKGKANKIAVKETDSKTVYEKQRRSFEDGVITMNGRAGRTNDKDQEDSTKTETITWAEISMTLDRMCFYLYTMIAVMLTVIFMAALGG